ncbi:MAG: alpha/beta fold hydrolase [Steroidobacteraceae bacterium]
MFPLFASHFKVCAMDRRGHGASGDSPDYSLQKEAEDIAAVVNSQPGDVAVMGHAYGGVCALEAAFLATKISELILYEPPVQDANHSAVIDRIQKLVRSGDRDQAERVFMQEIVMITPSELTAMKARSSWAGLVAGIPQLKQAISTLLATLPNRSLMVFKGQQHNAMDTVPQQFADAVSGFLLGSQSRSTE